MDLIGNINGLQICVEVNIDCLDENAKGLTITGDVKKLLIGNYDLNDSQKAKLLKYLNETFKETDWISVNPETEELVLDFSRAMSEAISSNAVLNTLISDAMNDSSKTTIKEGYISIKYSLGD